MHVACIVALSFAFLSVASPIKRNVDPDLVPPFGIIPNTNPDGHGNCDGVVVNSKPVLIPCSCPPDQTSFLVSLNANLNAGHVVNNPSIPPISFPTDSSTASQITRIQAVLITLQNLHGPGIGCPAASTTLLAKQKALQSGQSSPSASAQSSPSPSPSPNPVTPSSVAGLAPSLGFSSGINPTGTGDCDGAVAGANGQPIKVPCSCPPSQDEYISQLSANAIAGHAIHNPSVPLSFPLDDSPASQRARITAALITVQNLKGPGVGCPAASTTLSSQLAAVKD